MKSILGRRKNDVVTDVLAAVHVRTTVCESIASRVVARRLSPSWLIAAVTAAKTDRDGKPPFDPSRWSKRPLQ
jgi:hypothetical protein